VENALKHGIATMVDGGTIRVNSRLEEGALLVWVENVYDADAPTPRRPGLGLRNVRNRLETSFGSAARLTTHVSAQADHNVFRTEMILPCQTAH
jgi:LytS/YehU family sensor histidine kinase